jgi:beta-galactosidase
LSYITVEIVDSKEVRNPKAEELVKFTVEGAATIVAVGNANPKSIESFQATERTTWQGKCLVILKTKALPGKITLYASVPGLTKAELELTSSK